MIGNRWQLRFMNYEEDFIFSKIIENEVFLDDLAIVLTVFIVAYDMLSLQVTHSNNGIVELFHFLIIYWVPGTWEL